MKSKQILLAAAILLVIPVCASASETAELQVKRNDATVLTLRFSENSLRFFDEIPSQLTAVLREHGIDCCSSQTRVSESIWKCCHGKFSIISSNARLQSVLSAAFNGPKMVQR